MNMKLFFHPTGTHTLWDGLLPPVANGVPVRRVSQAKEKTALPTVNEKQPHASLHEVRKNYIT